MQLYYYSIDRTSIDDPRLQGDQKESWQDSALCTELDPDAFFPPPGGIPNQALKACDPCLVKFKCLAYTMQGEVAKGEDTKALRHGISGGLTPNEREKLEQLRKKHPSLTLEGAYHAIVSNRSRRGNKPLEKASQELQAL